MTKKTEIKINHTDPVWMTWVIAVANLIVYLAAEKISGGSYSRLIDLGGFDPTRIWGGEIWRFFSALFVHGNFLHLAFNTFVLVQVGRLLEPLITAPRFLLLYLFCGATGFAFSLLLNVSVSVGSSGAVFGLVGALMVFCATHNVGDKGLLRSLTIFVLINFAMGFLANLLLDDVVLIDNVSHVVGLLMGGLLGLALFADLYQSVRPKVAKIAIFASFLVFSISVLAAIKPSFLPRYYETQAAQALSKNDLELAKSKVAALSLFGRRSGSYELLDARLASLQGKTKHAERQFLKALPLVTAHKKNPWHYVMDVLYPNLDLNEALFFDEKTNKTLCQIMTKETQLDRTYVLNDCAWLLLMAKDPLVHDEKQALSWIEKAVRESKPAPAAMLHTLAEAYLQTGQNEEAKAAQMRATLQGGKQIGQLIAQDRDRLERRANKKSVSESAFGVNYRQD